MLKADQTRPPAEPMTDAERRQCLGAAYRILLAAVARQRALTAEKNIPPTEASAHDNLRPARCA